MTLVKPLDLESSITLSLAIFSRLTGYRLAVLFVLCVFAFVAQGQTTSLRQANIYEGEIAELRIEYEASIPSLYAIDTSILEADFELLGSDSKVSRILRDNQILHRMQWSVQLLPRRLGQLQIPALQYGDNFSEPMLLEVMPASAARLAQASVFVEVEAHPENPYPGQQTRLVTRLYHSLELHDGAFDEPDSGDLRVYRSGRESRYREERNGVDFKVIERSLLLTPVSSATLSIGPANYRGSIHCCDDIKTSANIRYIYRRSNEIKLQPRALPPGYSSDHWLPALGLELRIDWDDTYASPRAGHSLGFTLTLQATGLPAEALPIDLLSGEYSGYSIYADEPSRTTEIAGEPGHEQFQSRLQQRYAIILERSGEITLPALELRWWDLEQDIERIASLTATRMTVSAAEIPVDNRNPRANPDVLRSLQTDSQGVSGIVINRLHRYWPWIALSAFALLIPILVIVAGPLYLPIASKLNQHRTRRQCLRSLKRACRADDASAARRELLKWGRSHWSNARINGLKQLASHTLSQPGAEQWQVELAQLDAAVYGNEIDDWRGKLLWKLVQQAHKKETDTRPVLRTGRTDLLPELYPRTRIKPAL